MSSEHNNLDYIFSPLAIREKCNEIYQYAKAGGTHFILNEDKILSCAHYTLDVILENYPNLDIPFHSRWGHFQVGKKDNPKIDRIKKLNHSLENLSPIHRAKAKWNLVVPSVLLDAGAGMGWKYFDKEFNAFFSKSEGLALASLDMFYDGAFVDGNSLLKINSNSIKKYFQVSEMNPLVGVEGRALLLQNLGQVIKNKTHVFKNGQVGDLIDTLIEKSGNIISSVDILRALLDNFGSIWPGRLTKNNVNLGDVWIYSPLSKEEEFLVPFHKLSQWLTYSLLEPLIEAGLQITDVEKLTGLSEYRNGGLFLDFGVIELKNKELQHKQHAASSELVIEWRALTICLLDKIAKIIQEKLNQSEKDFPLAKVLEGGTWWAGRKIAKSKREDGGPPLQLQSDGTVF